MVNLLDLPTELRYRIYQFLYSSKPSYLILHLELGKRRIYEVPAHRGILSASRQCYEDAIDLHQESLTRLYVECDRFSVFQSTEQRPEAVVGYDRMFRNFFGRMPLDAHARQLLADIRRLTLPSFISADSILIAFERSAFVSLDTIEFVSCESPLLDQYVSSPSSESDDRDYNLDSAIYFNPPARWGLRRVSRWVERRKFRPMSQVFRSLFEWNAVNSIQCKARDELPVGQFRVLWTTTVRWTRERVKANEDDPDVVYRSAGVGPFCCLVEFVSNMFPSNCLT